MKKNRILNNNNNIETLQKYSQKLEKEVSNEKSLRLKIEEEFITNTKNHEEEVQLRLKFESKLNNMHSIHRDVDGKYKRSLKEIEGVIVERDNLQEKAKQYYAQLLDVTRIKEEKEAEIDLKDEKVKALTKENQLRKEQINNLENKLLSVQKSVEFKLNIEYVQGDSQKFDFAKYQPEERVDVYEQKFKDLESTYRNVVEELQKYKRESMIFEEVLKDKEERIAQTKSILNETQNSFKILDKQYSMLKLDYERATLNINDHKNELEETINKLKLTNKARNDNEIKLIEALESEKELK